MKLKNFKKVYSCGLTKFDIFKLTFLGIISGLLEIFSAGLIIKVSEIYLSNSIPIIGPFVFPNWNYAFFSIICFIFLKFALNYFSVKVQSKIIFNSISKVSNKLLGCYLKGSFENVINEGESIAIRNIYHESNLLGISVYIPSSIFLSEFIISFLLITYLIYINYLLVTPLLLSMILSIFFLWVPTKNKLKNLGSRRLTFDGERIDLITNTLRIIPDIKTQNLIDNYLLLYRRKTEDSTNAMKKLNIIKSLPRISAELIMFGSLLITMIIFLLLDLDTGLKNYEITGLLFVIYRLFPAITRINSAASTIRSHWESGIVINKTIEESRIISQKLYNTELDLVNLREIYWGPIGGNIITNSYKDLSFIKGINIIKGPSGSGKTSLLLGIANLNKNFKSILKNKSKNRKLKNNFNYTSQSTLLTGKNIKEAIVAGRNLNINLLNKFEVLIKDCFQNLDLDTKIKSLSGGQRKIVALLRSLYSNKKYHLFDEIFSGVDVLTTKKCIQFIRLNYKNTFFVIVDHNSIEADDADYIVNLLKKN